MSEATLEYSYSWFGSISNSEIEKKKWTCLKNHLAENLQLNGNIEDSNGKAFLHKALLVSRISCQKTTEARILQLVSVLGNQGQLPKHGLTPCWNAIKRDKAGSLEIWQRVHFGKNLV